MHATPRLNADPCLYTAPATALATAPERHS